ncbi:TIGR00266 family protein [Crocosphaera sp.]|uniref:TIGR00266 family protein n=1 Tax=Crocosphaera sp. TaxID=2729996 RepID=UPI0026258388|nr:TIGR00266 family protein [Crocosphaera sp.]MDJ0579899.1 TIGR00266 family protein [Crocosphaera sp.]
MSTNQHLEYQINNDPDSAYLMIKLKSSDKAFVKISALNIRDASIQIGKAVMNDSLDLNLNFSLTSNLTIHEITAPKLPGSVYLIPDVLGSIQHHYLDGESGIITQIFSFLACSEKVQLRVISSPNIKPISERDSFFLHLLGTGDLWLNYYGNIQEISVKGNYIINLSYLVAFEDTLNYEIKQLQNLSVSGVHIGTVGEHNLFCHFKGIGKIWIQSRHRYALLNFFAPFIH